MEYQMHFAPVLALWPHFATGALQTLILTAGSVFFGLIIGIIGAVARDSRSKILSRIVAIYVEIVRNTPMLVQMLILFFALPMVGIQISATVAALISISVNLGAYATEIIRSGIQAIPKTQIEAGLALGMSKLSVMRYIVIVPALQVIYPALTGQLTLTLQGTSIASAISAAELTSAASFVESMTFRSLETYLVLAVVYICLTFLFRLIYWLVALVLFRRKAPPKTHDIHARPENGSPANAYGETI